MSQLLSFHGDPAIKSKYLERVRAHAAADERSDPRSDLQGFLSEAERERFDLQR